MLSATHNQAHIELCWSANPAPNFRQAIVEDATDDSEEATCTCKRSTGGAIVADHGILNEKAPRY